MDVAQLRDGLFAQRCVEAQDLKLDLRDLAAKPANLGRKLPDLALDPGALPLKRQHPGRLRQAFCKKLLLVDQLFFDEGQLHLLAVDLAADTDDLGVDLFPALCQLLSLARERDAPGVEEADLPLHQRAHLNPVPGQFL